MSPVFVRVLIAIAMVTLVGCAGSGSKDTDDKTQVSPAVAKIVEEEGSIEVRTDGKPNDSGIVCEKIMKTGSHMPERYCYTVKEREGLTRKTQDTLRRDHNVNPKATEGPGSGQ